MVSSCGTLMYQIVGKRDCLLRVGREDTVLGLNAGARLLQVITHTKVLELLGVVLVSHLVELELLLTRGVAGEIQLASEISDHLGEEINR